MLRVRDVLALEGLSGVRAACSEGLDREVRWVHIWPEVLPWPHGGELLLTTGYSWPPQAKEQRRILRGMDHAGVAAILFRAGGRFFPRVPPAILDEAHSLKLPVLVAADDISFAALTERVNREIIRSQYEIIEQSERIHRTLTEAALDAQELTDITGRLSQLTGREILVLDRNLRVLAPLPPPASWVSLRSEIEGTFTRNSPPYRGGRGAVFPIRTGRDVTGYLVVLGDGGEMTEIQIRASEHGAVVLGLHLLRQQAMADAEARVRNTFVEAVLAGRLPDDPSLQERAHILGFDPHGLYLVLIGVVAGTHGEVRPRALASAEDFRLRSRLGHALHVALEASRLPVFSAYALNQAISVIPADLPPADLRERLQDVWRTIRRIEPDLPTVLAAGRPGRGDTGMPRSLAEAESALGLADGPGVWWYEDLWLLRILQSSSDHHALQELHRSTLGLLRQAGRPLYETARALVATNFHRREAARRLGVHWNTLRYRAARLEQVLGGCLDDPELRLRLHLACEVEKVLKRTLPSPSGEAP